MGKVSNRQCLVYVPYPSIRQKFILTNRCSWASPHFSWLILLVQVSGLTQRSAIQKVWWLKKHQICLSKVISSLTWYYFEVKLSDGRLVMAITVICRGFSCIYSSVWHTVTNNLRFTVCQGYKDETQPSEAASNSTSESQSYYPAAFWQRYYPDWFWWDSN